MTGKSNPVVFDQLAHQIHSNILDPRQVNVLHPMEITAGDVEQRYSPQFSQQPRQLAAERRGFLQGGTGTRNRFCLVPMVGLIDMKKTFFGVIVGVCRRCDFAFGAIIQKSAECVKVKVKVVYSSRIRV